MQVCLRLIGRLQLADLKGSEGLFTGCGGKSRAVVELLRILMMLILGFHRSALSVISRHPADAFALPCSCIFALERRPGGCRGLRLPILRNISPLGMPTTFHYAHTKRV